MKTKVSLGFLGACFLVTVSTSCLDEFEAEIPNFESILVVDARLTDQAKSQSVYLSRTFEFDSIPQPERNALVSLLNEGGTSISFDEVEPGTYTSDVDLRLLTGESYQLQITTQDGTTYTSDFEQVPAPVEIGGMRAIRRNSNSGVEGVAVVLDNQPNSGQPEYFRYEYEETYKIIAPDYNPREWDEVDKDWRCEDDDGWEVTTAIRQEEALTCFGSNSSINMILASTADLETGGLKDFEVRFLGRENFFISHRYSILVKQYHHSTNASSFFTTLLDFSDFQSVFSNVQTGALESNVSANNSSAPVLGYFELSSYSEKRMFFSYSDLFPNEPLPPYIINCDRVSKPALYPLGFHVTLVNGKWIVDGNTNSPLIDGILAGFIGYYDRNGTYLQTLPDGTVDRAPYLVKPLGCVDCRAFGSNVVPEFWIE